MPLLIVMAGLPGAGKSAVGRELAKRLQALRWNKDELRELLFPAAQVSHDRALNDFCMEMLYSGMGRALASVPFLIIDGRPFTERAQRERVREAAKAAGVPVVFVHCTASIDVLRERVSRGSHIAPDRDAALLERLMVQAEPFEGDEITVDTAKLAAADAAWRCLSELRSRGLLQEGS